MVRTRAAAHAPGVQLPSRRNPSRSSRVANLASSRQPKRLRTDVSAGSGTSEGEGDSEANASTTSAESDIGSSSDVQFESPPRRKPTRASSRISTAQHHNRRRSARQAAVSNPQRQSKPSPQNTPQAPASRGPPTRQLKGRHKKTSGASNKRRKTQSLEPETNIPQGIIPEWQDPRIPYEAWSDIFYYAATSGGTGTLDVNWLLNASMTCRAFSDPALSAIYRSPPINTAGKARRLAALLDRPPSETRTNYGAKIQSLYLDVAVVPQNVLFKLIHSLPRLQELVFYTHSDQAPYRELDRTVRWHYFEEIFHALQPASSESGATCRKGFTTLKSWEWSGSLLGGHVASIDDIARIHQEPFFTQLTKLSFTNLQVPSLRDLRPKPGDEESELKLYNEDGAVINSVAKAIAQLHSLRHLVFESSTVMNDRLLPLLPKGLVHLGLINCWEIKSEDFTPFLHSHGHDLQTLNLSHNQSLDMAFLTDLADACPHLEELHMNLSYYRHHFSLVANDADPFYDQALLPDQVPKWPASIRTINLEHVRHWSVETAEMFLQSLIDSAGTLPDLRYLAVKTMLNIPWKARASMRHEWRRKLERVFLRRCESPQNVSSLRTPEAGEELAHVKEKKRESLPERPSRRSGRLAAQTSDSDSRQTQNGKGLRSLGGRPLYKDPDTDEDEFDQETDEAEAESSKQGKLQEEGENDGVTGANPTVVQGRCATVAVVFDNQKPTELQWGMEDFMDNDGSQSDEEWDGDEEDDVTVFAWR